MWSQSSFTRTLVAIAGALLMSTVAIGAAIGPAQANATTPLSAMKVPTYA
jgi:hypothetical protein